MAAISSDSVDLALSAVGLHHYSEDVIDVLLSHVARILRPGGVLLLREHDATPDVLPLLHVAHLTFNAYTGVPFDEELRDQVVRHFEPLACWQQRLLKHGLVDTFVSTTQPRDPTRNFLMAFQRPH
jgi:SAM-dependent methyltransferase